MNKLLAIFTLVFIPQLISAQEIRGISVDSSRLWYAQGAVIKCLDLVTDQIVLEKDLSQDVQMLDLLASKSVSLFKADGDSILKDVREHIESHLKLVNITCYQKFVFAGIAFHTNWGQSVPTRYAILKYNKQLKLLDYYVFCLTNKSRFFTLPPFQELDIIDTGMIAAMINSNPGFDYCKLKLNKSHEVRVVSELGKQIKTQAMPHLHIQEAVVTHPLLYAVPHSVNNVFYEFPYPVFHRIKKDYYIDPYRIKRDVDSIGHAKNQSFRMDVYHLDFKTSLKKYENVVMACTQKNDTLYAVISNRGRGKIDLLYGPVKSEKFQLKQLDILMQQYFYFKENKLYTFNSNTGKVKVYDVKILIGP